MIEFSCLMCLGLIKMEIEMNNNAAEPSFIEPEGDDLIKVRALISCPSGDYKKKFKNQFPRKDLELMVVAFKIFDFMTCSKCGELLNLNLEFEI
ncbi:unnamed protein product [marine sediment metagenome]|uniref:Uncharacterized protein n=1 Tax=marine sediment metagenome TaxID=412755 RepID=X1HUH0_9ZZZZ